MVALLLGVDCLLGTAKEASLVEMFTSLGVDGEARRLQSRSERARHCVPAAGRVAFMLPSERTSEPPSVGAVARVSIKATKA